MFSRTKRLLLRPGWAEDTAPLHQLWSEEAISRNLPDQPPMLTQAKTAEFLMRERDVLAPYFLLFSRTGGAPRLIGGCGISIGCSERPELSFWIGRPFWGLGFATEAARAATRIARASGLDRLTARPMIGNRAGINVLEKLGFRPTGQCEKRISAACGGTATCVLYEDSGEAPMRSDSAMELYRDGTPIAA